MRLALLDVLLRGLGYFAVAIRFPSLLRFHRIASLLPSVEAAGEGVDILKAAVAQYLRHPGAGSLVRSGAIRNDQATLGDVRAVALNFVGRYADRTRQLDGRGSPRFGVARVEEDERLATIHLLFDFGSIILAGSILSCLLLIFSFASVGVRRGLGFRGLHWRGAMGATIEGPVRFHAVTDYFTTAMGAPWGQGMDWSLETVKVYVTA